MRRFTQGFYGYVFAMAVCLAGVAIFLVITPQSRSEHIPTVDYSIDLANARREAPFEVWAPTPRSPANWLPTSSRLVQDAKTVTWRLGFATAKRMHAMLAQSSEVPAAQFANRMANTSASIGTQQVNGITWEKRYREDKKQRTLVHVLPDVTVVVTGSADWDELAALAATLKPHPKPPNPPSPSPSTPPSTPAPN